MGQNLALRVCERAHDAFHAHSPYYTQVGGYAGVFTRIIIFYYRIMHSSMEQHKNALCNNFRVCFMIMVLLLIVMRVDGANGKR